MTTSHDHSPVPSGFPSSARWIWGALPTGAPPTGDYYRCFRRRFRLDDTTGTTTAALVISASTDFVAWINGIEVTRGQFSDWPERKTWTRFNIPPETLQTGAGARGENILAVLVFHCCGDFATHVAGLPGLIVALSVGSDSILSAADGAWLTSPHAGFAKGRSETMTPQTGYTFEYDARREEDWLAADFDDDRGAWTPVETTIPMSCTLEPRPLPALVLGELGTVRIKAQGIYFELATTARPLPESPADRMAARALRPEPPWRVFANPQLRPMFASLDPSAAPEDVASADAQYTGAPVEPGLFLNHAGAHGIARPSLVLSASSAGRDGAHGRYLIIDLGEEAVGLLEFEIEGSAGTVIEIAHGEHLDDGRVRMKIGGRRFADRYVCGDGAKRFQMPFRRFGARYLELHAAGFGEVRIFTIGLRRVSYPINGDKSGSFLTDDPLAGRIWDTAVRTLDLCRHEHFEDCPWREQALYPYDARLQALYGYHAFGDYRFAEVSLGLIGRGFDRASGLLPLVTPGRCPVNIPGFTLAWIGALAEHWLYSGSGALYAEFRSTIRAIIETACATHDENTGLYFAPSRRGTWNFFEWTPGLCGAMEPPDAGERREFHSIHLLHLHDALRSASWMAERAGESTEATELAVRASLLAISFRRWFRNDITGLWSTTLEWAKDGGLRRSGAHEWVQAFAALELGETMPERSAPAGWAPCSLSSLQTLARAGLNGSADGRRQLFRRLETTWADMLFSGATTFWETAAGARDFDFAGSLCHGWNGLPTWFYHTVILGVRPLSPGFHEFAVRIHPYRFATARGRIPIPAGFIEIEWRLRDDGLHVEVRCPSCSAPSVEAFPEAPVASFICNGVPIVPPRV